VRFGLGEVAARIQDEYLAGRKEEAAALVPVELLEGTSLIGSEGLVAERLAAMKEAGVTTLNVTPLAGSHEERVRLIERVRDLTA
jgi:alkanesulfonate monooxygenase SsuD/methylene tetrahydromethanopterin reductase-like flavin-dependent oxidoreductase (luciferase family)